MKKINLYTALSLFICSTLFAIEPNPKISVGQPIYSDLTWSSSLLNDGAFGTAWYFSPGNWAAMELSSPVPDTVLFNWNSVGGNWSDEIPAGGPCPGSKSFPTSYQILSSLNSTDGLDGDWDTLTQVTNNVVAGRQHLLELRGANWVKMEILEGSGGLDEIEIFDVQNGAEDSWFFLGTSITMMTYKSLNPDSSFADLVNAEDSTYSPAIIRGGVGCINSTNVLNSISDYLDVLEGVHFVAIEMGTNDAWGGSTWALDTYKKNMQAIIDSIKGRGMEPVLARPPATDSARAEWQMDAGFPEAIDALTEQNDLIPGPDLYAWFLAHPEELSADGVHPGSAGAQSIIREWAKAMLENAYPTKEVTPLKKLGLSSMGRKGFWDGLGRACKENCPLLHMNSEGTKSPF